MRIIVIGMILVFVFLSIITICYAQSQKRMHTLRFCNNSESELVGLEIKEAFPDGRWREKEQFLFGKSPLKPGWCDEITIEPESESEIKVWFQIWTWGGGRC